jgi:ribose transport system ATP-binding protein
MRSISKTFGAATVLSDVQLNVQPGEIHALVGQNGSGKSTLVKILTGYYRPDRGAEIAIDGQPLKTPIRWQAAKNAGLAVVHQDLGLVDHMTVTDNICVGSFPTVGRPRRIDARATHAVARSVLERLEVAIDPRRHCADLSAAERAEVAIARALRDQHPGRGLTILDESTRALTGQALTRFYELMRRVAASGGSILMISHSLTEVVSVADRVTVLRDGKVAASGLNTGEVTEPEIATLMLGQRLRSHALRGAAVAGDGQARVELEGLKTAELAELSLQVRQGEVLGITGATGTGIEKLPYILFGSQPAEAGKLRVDENELDLSAADMAATLRAGVALVPERRDRDGLAFSLSTSENFSLPLLKRRGRPWLVKRSWQREEYAEAVAALGIRPAGPAALVRDLSGGNQQKVLLAKWLATDPKLLILHEPTQAVDVGARQDLLRAIRGVAERGVAVLLVSSEADDLAALCDRVLVYAPSDGLQELHDFTPDTIIAAAYGTQPAGPSTPPLNAAGSDDA